MEEFARGDFSRMADVADDWEFVTTSEMPDAGTYQGDAGRQWVMSWVESFEGLTIEVTEIIDAGDKVFSAVVQRGRIRREWGPGGESLVDGRLVSRRHRCADRGLSGTRPGPGSGWAERVMSQANVVLVQGLYEAFSRGDVDEIVSHLDPEAELHSAIVGGAEGYAYRGHAGFRAWYADSFETFESFSFDWSEFRDLGDRVLALGQLQARGRESGVELASEMGWVHTIRRGTLTKIEGFLSHADALEAAGLRD